MKIRLFATLRIAAGRSEIDAHVGQMRELMDVLTEVAGPVGDTFWATLFDGERALAQDVVVCVNDRVIGRGERVLVRDSDEVSLLMPLAGGSTAQ